MANDLVKAAIKVAAALAAAAFSTRVGKEGKKNFDDWRNKNGQQK